MSELIKYALRKGTNEIVHIDSAQRGLNCDCMCPYCKGDMEARQGNIRDHSFAHAKGVSDCGKAGMSMLHLMAQKIIEEEKKVMLPAFQNNPEQQISFDDVRLEESDLDVHRRPDCIGIKAEDKLNPLWIEIFVCHAVDEIKAKDIQTKKQPCIEIDLSGFYGADYSKDQLKDHLLNSSETRQWIYYPLEPEQTYIMDNSMDDESPIDSDSPIAGAMRLFVENQEADGDSKFFRESKEQRRACQRHVESGAGYDWQISKWWTCHLILLHMDDLEKCYNQRELRRDKNELVDQFREGFSIPTLLQHISKKLDYVGLPQNATRQMVQEKYNEYKRANI